MKACSIALVLLSGLALPTRADVFHMPDGLTSLETVSVGDPGNEGELSGMGVGGWGPDRMSGAVDHVYQIGKYEVTAGQYTVFLNAVAGADEHSLYNVNMASTVHGCGITRSGSGTLDSPYTYSVSPVFANRPVNLVNWADGARFCNWLHNGQPEGPQGLNTTEDGSYFLNGATTNDEVVAILRKSNATWAIPTEDEWYKAAYYKSGSTDAGYWKYPTRSDSVPGRDLADSSGNNANYYTKSGPWPIDSGYFTTKVGEFEDSASPYGTFDQGGNLWEWNESVLDIESGPYYRGVRGGSYWGSSWELQSSFRGSRAATFEAEVNIGFRVVQVPEPGSLGLLAVGTLTLIRRK